MGDVHSDRKLTEVILANNFDFNRSLDTLLNQQQQQTASRQTENVERGN